MTQRLTARNGALLVVDLQDKLLAAIADRERVVANVVHLIRGAKSLGLPVWGTEQYPRGLGPSTAAVAELIPDRPGQDDVSLLCRPPAPGTALWPQRPPRDRRGDRGPCLRGPDRARIARSGVSGPGAGRRGGLTTQDRLGVCLAPARTGGSRRLDHRSRAFRVDGDGRSTRVQGDQRVDQDNEPSVHALTCTDSPWDGLAVRPTMAGSCTPDERHTPPQGAFSCPSFPSPRRPAPCTSRNGC